MHEFRRCRKHRQMHFSCWFDQVASKLVHASSKCGSDFDALGIKVADVPYLPQVATFAQVISSSEYLGAAAVGNGTVRWICQGLQHPTCNHEAASVLEHNHVGRGINFVECQWQAKAITVKKF